MRPFERAKTSSPVPRLSSIELELSILNQRHLPAPYTQSTFGAKYYSP